MIVATVNKGEVKCSIEGEGIHILSELTILTDSILDKFAKDDKNLKKDVIAAFCESLYSINK